MNKNIFILLIILTLIPLPYKANSADSWKKILIMKSGRNQTQDVMSESVHSRSKFLKIRYESQLDPKFESGNFRIGCYRTYGNKSCYEAIVPRTDCNYYVYEEAIIYGWELGFSDYQFNVKSEGMDWTITVFEYEDYEKEPVFEEQRTFLLEYTQEEESRSKRNQDNYPEKRGDVSFTPENGEIRLIYFADLISTHKDVNYSLTYTIDSNPGCTYSIGYNKGYTIHIKKGATITFHVVVKGYEVGIKLYQPILP